MVRKSEAETETASRQYRELEAKHGRERAAHRRARRRVARLGIAVTAPVAW